MFRNISGFFCLGAIGCCVRSQRGAVTLCLGVISIDPRGEPLREWVMAVSYYSTEFRTVLSSLHKFTISPRDLDLPLSQKLFVFRRSSWHDIHPHVLRRCGITHDASAILICYTTDVGFQPACEGRNYFYYTHYAKGVEEFNVCVSFTKNMNFV